MYKENCYLYRSFNPKWTTYESDGLGRDLYISYNNGGLYKQFTKPIIPTSTQYSVLNHNHYFSKK